MVWVLPRTVPPLQGGTRKCTYVHLGWFRVFSLQPCFAASRFYSFAVLLKKLRPVHVILPTIFVVSLFSLQFGVPKNVPCSFSTCSKSIKSHLPWKLFQVTITIHINLRSKSDSISVISITRVISCPCYFPRSTHIHTVVSKSLSLRELPYIHQTESHAKSKNT